MKKVGIITAHRYHNYGTVLQAYATFHTVNKLNGYKAEVIDYYQESERQIWNHRLYKVGYPANLKRLFLYRILFHKKIQERFNKFENFVNENLNLSKAYHSMEDFKRNPTNYDIYISGSDQIWNYAIAKRSYSYNDIYKGNYAMLPNYLAFTESSNKISYSTSMGDCLTFYNRNLISKYKRILVREKDSEKYLNKILNRTDVKQVLEPTLLLKLEDYKKFLIEPNIGYRYILAYMFDWDREEYKKTLKLITELSKKLNMKVIMVNTTVPVNNKRIKTLVDVGPEEWLGLIKNAELIITNSFHGTVFSVNFNVPFYTISDDSRKDTILQSVKLKNRCISPDINVNELLNYKMDFTEVNKILSVERKRSLELLEEALNSCT